MNFCFYKNVAKADSNDSAYTLTCKYDERKSREFNLVFSMCVGFIWEWLFTDNRLPTLSTLSIGVGASARKVPLSKVICRGYGASGGGPTLKIEQSERVADIATADHGSH